MSYRRGNVTISFFPPLTPMVRTLLIVTGAAFLLTYLPSVFMGLPVPLFSGVFGLTPYLVTHRLFLWQLGTYLFIHAGWFHVIFNLFALWMFGPALESRWGSRQFLFYFFVTGAGAGLFNVLLEPNSVRMTVGDSGAIYGLLLAFGVLFPDQPIFLWFVIIIGAIELYSSLALPGSSVSHVAHLGGILVGYLYLRGGRVHFDFERRYQDWRRARLRRKFEGYMRKHESKDNHGRWVN